MVEKTADVGIKARYCVEPAVLREIMNRADYEIMDPSEKNGILHSLHPLLIVTEYRGHRKDFYLIDERTGG
jgi:hypothetical protein